MAPKVNPENFQSFYITNSGWGIVKQQILRGEITFTLSILYGELLLKKIILEFFDDAGINKIQSCKVINSEGEILVETVLNKKDSNIEISFQKPITLKESQLIQVKLD